MKIVALLTALLAACSTGGESPPTFTGSQGVPVPVVIESGTVVVTAGDSEFTGPGQEHVVLDTGAPYVLLDSQTHGQSDRPRSPDLHLVGLDFPRFPVAFDGSLSSVPDYDLEHLDGLIGGSVLKWFAFTIDYQGARVVLAERPMPPADAAVGATTRLPFRLVGTRILVPLTVEGVTLTAMVDTGASLVGLRRSAFTRLATRTGRPTLDGGSTETVYGFKPVQLVRLAEVSLGQGVVLTGLPAMVESDESLYAGISQEVGEPVQALVGGSLLREYLVTIDYPERELWLAPYTDRSHIDPHEFVQPGLSIVRGLDPEAHQAAWLVKAVYAGHPAAAAGVAVGDVLLAVGGMEVGQVRHQAIAALLAHTPVGQTLTFRMRHAGVETDVPLAMEDLLPSWP